MEKATPLRVQCPAGTPAPARYSAPLKSGLISLLRAPLYNSHLSTGRASHSFRLDFIRAPASHPLIPSCLLPCHCPEPGYSRAHSVRYSKNSLGDDPFLIIWEPCAKHTPSNVRQYPPPLGSSQLLIGAPLVDTVVSTSVLLLRISLGQAFGPLFRMP